MSDSLLSPRTIAPPQAPCPWNSPRQEYWNGLLFHSPRDLPDPGINPGLLHYRQETVLYHLSHQADGISCNFKLDSQIRPHGEADI